MTGRDFYIGSISSGEQFDVKNNCIIPTAQAKIYITNLDGFTQNTFTIKIEITKNHQVELEDVWSCLTRTRNFSEFKILAYNHFDVLQEEIELKERKSKTHSFTGFFVVLGEVLTWNMPTAAELLRRSRKFKKAIRFYKKTLFTSVGGTEFFDVTSVDNECDGKHSATFLGNNNNRITSKKFKDEQKDFARDFCLKAQTRSNTVRTVDKISTYKKNDKDIQIRIRFQVATYEKIYVE